VSHVYLCVLLMLTGQWFGEPLEPDVVRRLSGTFEFENVFVTPEDGIGLEYIAMNPCTPGNKAFGFVLVSADCNPVDIKRTPNIPPGTTAQGICLIGTSDIATVTLQDDANEPNSGLQLHKDEDITLGYGDGIILMWADSVWGEIGRWNAQDRP